MEQCDGGFVTAAPEERGVRATSAYMLGRWTGAIVTCHKNRLQLLRHYCELHYVEVSLPLNKNDGFLVGLLQRSDGAWYIPNSVRELSDQASCFPNT